jgi:hypothetical protein
MEGSGRCLIQGIIPAFALGDWGRSREPWQVVGLRAEILTRDISNKKQVC